MGKIRTLAESSPNDRCNEVGGKSDVGVAATRGRRGTRFRAMPGIAKANIYAGW